MRDAADALALATRGVKTERARAMEAIWSELGPRSRALELCARASRATDEAAVACWELAAMPESCALVAVGGYGRAQLWPGSDLDVMILASDGLPADVFEAACARLSAALWDCGLEPGLSARRVGECAELCAQDATIATALMERRLVAGRAELFGDLGRALAGFPALPFFMAKAREQRERHERHGDSPFGLEPNVKESPGGLRDLQMPMWAARAMGIEPTWDGLRRAGLLTGGEAELAAACEARLALVRAMLHRARGRREERLDFDAQAKLAEALGIGSEEGKSAAAVTMDGYFACARSAVMVNEVLLAGMSERLWESEKGERRALSERFYAQGGLLWAADDEVFAREPAALFEAFRWMQTETDLRGMGSRCTRALWRAGRRVDAWFRADEGNRERFAAMLKSPRRVVTELTRMARVGLLGAYVPAFGRAETLMQHDLFHAWTVGRHTLGVVRNLRRFQREDRAGELPMASSLARDFEDYWLLYVAALFHDIAKGRGGSHEEKGEVDARDFCRAHGVEGEDAELVAFLVRRHLEMSRVSQKRDIEDPEVVGEFAALCGTARRLDALYLLTAADMRATGPTVWSAWKGQLLDRLWRKARQALAGSVVDPEGRVERARAAALRAASEAGADPERAGAMIGRMGELYFLRTPPQDCAWHARGLAERGLSIPACLSKTGGEGRVKVAVWCQDRPGVFSRICAALALCGLSVDEARIFPADGDWALDAFAATDLRALPDESERMAQIEEAVVDALGSQGGRSTPSLGRVSPRARSAGSVAEARVSPAGSDWIVEVACADRAGVLWSIADELERRGLSIKSARVATVGERAEDVFVVEGGALDAPQSRLDLEAALISRLGLC